MLRPQASGTALGAGIASVSTHGPRGVRNVEDAPRRGSCYDHVNLLPLTPGRGQGAGGGSRSHRPRPAPGRPAIVMILGLNHQPIPRLNYALTQYSYPSTIVACMSAVVGAHDPSTLTRACTVASREIWMADCHGKIAAFVRGALVLSSTSSSA